MPVVMMMEVTARRDTSTTLSRDHYYYNKTGNLPVHVTCLSDLYPTTRAVTPIARGASYRAAVPPRGAVLLRRQRKRRIPVDVTGADWPAVHPTYATCTIKTTRTSTRTATGAAPTSSTSLTTPAHRYGGVAPWVFQQLLPLARTLTHFSYGDRMPGGLRGFYPSGFARALMCAKATLQSLVLCFAGADEGGEVDHMAGAIGSLRDWPVLRSVRCSLAPLSGGGGAAGGCAAACDTFVRGRY